MELILDIEKLVAKGEGLAHHEGKAVFVSSALASERVRAVVTEEKGDYLRAETTEVITPSPERITPVCPYYGRCGGCDFQHASTEAQVSAKEAIVLENLRRIGGIDVSEGRVTVLPSVTGAPWGYRNRVRFHVDPEGGNAGFLSRGSNELVDISRCPILCDTLNLLLDEKRSLLLKAAHMRRSREGWQHRKRWVEVPAFAGDSQVSLSNREVSVEVLGKTLWADSNVFFQSNAYVLPSMVESVLSHVTGTQVMDLYAGVGTFSAFVEGEGRTVIAVERDKRCLELARKNLEATEFFTQSAEHWARSGRTVDVDTVIVDPPRTGLGKEVVDAIASWNPTKVVYVSCDSGTFARDCKRFSSHGYHLDTLQLFDLYPQTSHTETIAVLVRI